MFVFMSFNYMYMCIHIHAHIHSVMHFVVLLSAFAMIVFFVACLRIRFVFKPQESPIKVVFGRRHRSPGSTGPEIFSCEGWGVGGFGVYRGLHFLGGLRFRAVWFGSLVFKEV